MKISRQAWHWRWLRYVGTMGLFGSWVAPKWTRDYGSPEFNGPPNVCMYFWAVVFSPGGFLLAVGMLPLAWIGTIIFYAVRYAIKGPVLLVLGACLLVRRSPQAESIKPGLRTVISTYVAARKRKVCPLIEYVGEVTL